jgi:hypothetical protein
MNTSVNRVVYKEKYGTWINKIEYSDEPSSTHYTQLAAIVSAKVMLQREGGGTLIVRAPNGSIRERIEVHPDKVISVETIKGGYR